MTEQRPPEQERIAKAIRHLENVQGACRLSGFPDAELRNALIELDALATAHQQSLERERDLREFIRQYGLEQNLDDWLLGRSLAANPSEEEAK